MELTLAGGIVPLLSIVPVPSLGTTGTLDRNTIGNSILIGAGALNIAGILSWHLPALLAAPPLYLIGMVLPILFFLRPRLCCCPAIAVL